MSAAQRWVGMVVGLLLMSVAIQTTAIILSVGDPSFAIDPDYEAKGRDFDKYQREKFASDALGWTARISSTPDRVPGWVDLRVDLRDDTGQEIDHATVTLEALHVARASHISRGKALRVENSEGYHCRLPLNRDGIWEFHVEALRGEDRFVDVVRESLVCSSATRR